MSNNIFTPDPRAYGANTNANEKGNEEDNIQSNSTQQSAGASGKKRKLSEMNDANQEQGDDYDQAFFGTAEKAEDKKLRSELMKKIIRLLRRNPEIMPKTMADYERNLNSYSIKELEEVFENIMYDIQAKSGTPFSDFLIWFLTIPFVRAGNGKFRKICHKDVGLKQDMENEITFTVMDINNRIQILFKFINNFLKSMGYIDDEDESDSQEEPEEKVQEVHNLYNNSRLTENETQSNNSEQQGNRRSEEEENFTARSVEAYQSRSAYDKPLEFM